VILDKAKMCKHTYGAYKDKIKVENIITALFKDYKIRKQKVLREIEHVSKAFHSTIKGIHLALEVKTSFDNSTSATDSNTESSSQKPGVPTDSRHRHHRKQEKEEPAHKGYKEKLERLRLARLIRHNQAVNF
jgi:hypothetical protein